MAKGTKLSEFESQLSEKSQEISERNCEGLRMP